MLLREAGMKIRFARKQQGRTIAQVAESVEDASYLGEVERGRANVSITTLAALSSSLGVSLLSLLPEENA